MSKRNGHAIYIEGLPQECVETDLIKLLQQCGKVNSVSIVRQLTPSLPPPRPNSISASVEFQQREQAEAAIYLLENSVVWGRRLSANWMSPSLPSHGSFSGPSGSMNSKALRSAQVHISYLTKQLVTIVTEQMILDLFSTFGKVIEVSLKKKCVDTEMCIQNGYGFVHYPLTPEGIESALRAVETLHQVTINNISYDCSISNQLKQVLLGTGRLPAETSPSSSAAAAPSAAAGVSRNTPILGNVGTNSGLSSPAGLLSAGRPQSSNINNSNGNGNNRGSGSHWWEEGLSNTTTVDHFPSIFTNRAVGGSFASHHPASSSSSSTNASSTNNAIAASIFPSQNTGMGSLFRAEQTPSSQQQHSPSMFPPLSPGSNNHNNSLLGDGLHSHLSWDASSSSSMGGRVSLQSGATSAYMPSIASLDSHGSSSHGMNLGNNNNNSFYRPGNNNHHHHHHHLHSANSSQYSSASSSSGQPMKATAAAGYSSFDGLNNGNVTSNHHLFFDNAAVYGHQQSQQQQQLSSANHSTTGSFTSGSGRMLSTSSDINHHNNNNNNNNNQYFSKRNVPLIAEDEPPMYFASSSSVGINNNNINTNNSKSLSSFQKWF